MEVSAIMLVCVIFLTFILVFVLGLGLGFWIGKNNSQGDVQTPGSFLKSNGMKKQKNSLEIDDTKVVLKIDTQGMEKKFDNITKETSVKNDISNSVNKLKSMKGK